MPIRRETFTTLGSALNPNNVYFVDLFTDTNLSTRYTIGGSNTFSVTGGYLTRSAVNWNDYLRTTQKFPFRDGFYVSFEMMLMNNDAWAQVNFAGGYFPNYRFSSYTQNNFFGGIDESVPNILEGPWVPFYGRWHKINLIFTTSVQQCYIDEVLRKEWKGVYFGRLSEYALVIWILGGIRLRNLYVHGIENPLFSLKTNCGSLHNWGSGAFGACGNLSQSTQSTPYQIPGTSTKFKKITTNVSTSSRRFGIKTDGTLWAWGYNEYGALGLGLPSPNHRSSPTQVGALTTWRDIGAGWRNVGAIKNDGTLWTWGLGYLGQTGHNNTIDCSSPVQVGTLTKWVRIRGAANSMIGMQNDGTLWSWGRNDASQSPIFRSSPVQIAANWGGWVDFSMDGSGRLIHMIHAGGGLYVCGNNDYGRCGLNTSGGDYSFTQVGSLTTWRKLSGGNTHYCHALKHDGTLWGWGRNDFGQLGRGSGDNWNRSSPVQIGSLTTWIDIAGVGAYTIALKSDGTLWGWGYGSTGSSPIQIGSARDWIQISGTAGIRLEV